MRLRNWLLTGTSLGILVFAPVTVAQAQDAALIAAYEQFVVASSSGDADATAVAQDAFLAECARVGVPNADECIALIQNGPAPAAEEAVPAEEPVVEEPVAEEPVVEQPAPEVQVQEAPVEQPVAEEPAPEPVAEEPAPEPVAEEPAPEPVAEEPVVEEQPAEQQTMEVQAEEQPAVEVAPEVAPEEQTMAPAIDYETSIRGLVDTYNQAVAAQVADDNSDIIRETIATLPGQIADLCSQAGFASTEECLATYGLEMAPAPEIPPGDQMVTEPVVDPNAQQIEVPLDNLPTAEEPAGALQIETIPDVAPEEAAPLLDSVKEITVDPNSGVEPAILVETPTEPAAPPPADDQQAQAAIQPEEIVSLQAEQGQVIEAAPALEVPQNVTIINNVVNNTTVNNTVVNNTTNNTTNNNGDTINQANFQVILQIGTQIIINNPEQERDRFLDEEDEVYYEQLSRGRVRETIERPDGSRIVTIRNRNGDILQRSRFTPDGREIVLAYFDDRYDEDLLEWRDPGDDLPPLFLTISARDYVMDAEDADEEDVEVFFRQPPVEQVRRIYSIDEVKRSARLRDSVRRLEVGGLTFDSGAATIARTQVGALSKVAAGMVAMLEENPGETFLIEGHSDAVGSDIANLRLSDLRAATVARILTDFYDIPAENLVTQGYGERYLKVKTEEAERLNRRVTVRRITPLITPVASR
jgi:outer membrane protein OmpA-like peptidoglycan-associated protein/outer membrane biosynthesis protein TonB